MKVKAYSRVDRGLEDLVIKDLLEEHNIVARQRNMRGKIFYETTLNKVIELNLTARSINRVIILLDEKEISNLDDIYNVIRRIDLTNYLDQNSTFAIRANRIGKHNFTSLDIARVSGKAVIDNYKESTGKKLTVNLNNPDVEIVVEVIEKLLLVGLDTTGLSLHIRRYRAYNHPMPMKTTIAYLLVKLSEWDRKSKLVDPTCGGATIPIEAAHYLKKIPICYFRSLEEYTMTNIPIFDADIIRKKCNEFIEKIQRNKKAPIFGVEINKDFVEGAKLNVKNAKVEDTVTIIHGDATRLDRYVGMDVKYLIANPPYSLPNRTELSLFYKHFTKSIEKVLEEDGVAVVITSESKLMKRNISETKLKIIHERTVPYGSLFVTIFKLTK